MNERLPQHKPEPLFNVPTVVLAVIGVLAAIHFSLWALGEDAQVWALYTLSFIPSRFGGEAVAFPQGAQYWSFLTYGLLHGDSVHLGSNCLWLLIFSTPLARRLGVWRYLVFLVVTVIAGAFAVLFTHWGKMIIVVGASAAVSATLAAAIPIMFAPGFRARASDSFDIRNMRVLSFSELLKSPRALVFAGVFMALTFITGVSQYLTGTAFLEERNIAWEAHLGGFLVGLAMFYLLDRILVSSKFRA